MNPIAEDKRFLFVIYGWYEQHYANISIADGIFQTVHENPSIQFISIDLDA